MRININSLRNIKNLEYNLENGLILKVSATSDRQSIDVNVEHTDIVECSSTDDIDKVSWCKTTKYEAISDEEDEDEFLENSVM